MNMVCTCQTLLYSVLAIWIVQVASLRLPPQRLRRQGSLFFGGSVEENEPAAESCQRPGGNLGICVDLPRCDEALRILTAGPNPAQLNYLQSITCKFDGDRPFVCCSENGEDDGAFEAVSGGGRNTGPPKRTSAKPPILPVTVSPPPTQPVPKPQEVCGESNATITRIVGGQNAAPGAWPWMAALFVANEQGKTNFEAVSCGGALVSSDYVITAAHCVLERGSKTTKSPALFTARFGDLDISTDADGLKEVNVEIAEIIPHPDFSPTSFHNDIAVLKLARPVQFTKFIKPICLPPAEEVGETYDGMQPHIAGWGTIAFNSESSATLRQVQVQIVPNSECKEAYKPFKQTSVEPTQLCAGFAGGKKDACQGDSGGPLMLAQNQRWHLIGVVSFGFKCAQPGFPGVYTRVTAYRDWITQQTKL